MAHKEVVIDFRFEDADYTVTVPCFYQGMIVRAGDTSVSLHKRGNKYVAKAVSSN